MFTKLALRYDHWTGLIVKHCPHPDKFAHTYAGMLIWLFMMVIVRRPRSVLPLATVLAVELVNEFVDRLAHGSWMWKDTLGDMAATWFWPVVLTAAWRWTPRRSLSDIANPET